MRKPQAEIFKLAAQVAGVPLKQCLFVDDQSNNIKAAKSAGMDGLVFTSTEQLYKDLVRKKLLHVN